VHVSHFGSCWTGRVQHRLRSRTENNLAHTFLVLVAVGVGHGVYRKLYTLTGGQRAEKFENHWSTQSVKWFVFAETKPRSILIMYGSAVKLRNTCRRSLTQRWVSWSCSGVPEVSVETQTRLTKGQKWAVTGRSKPELCIFNVTTVCLCVA